MRNPLVLLIFSCWALLAVVDSLSALDKIQVRLDASAAQQPITGRLFVFFTRSKQGEPRHGPDWFHPEPFFAREVDNLASGQSATLDDTADGYPGKLSELVAGTYRAQAVLHQDFDCPFPGSGVGNPYSEVVDAEVHAAAGQLELVLDRTVQASKFPETPWRKEVVLRSQLLSEFHRREVFERATVVLPEKYDDEPGKRYPVLYIVPGFGGSHRDALRLNAPPPVDESGVAFIRVYLSGRCQWGHHVFADSATNGPRGAALVQELIPHIDRSFHTDTRAAARFVTGHSSGGWSSLWLQVTYPETFGGVWSTGPDPVDFRDYQRVNLYADPPQNMYHDELGERRPIARRGETPVLWYDDFTKMDDVIGRGGQLRSFEAVFSPLGPQGSPRRMYDRPTGRVDPAVVEAWKRYDIRLKLERDWPELEPRLRGKLHIFMGDRDTFYLEGAVKQLAETLKSLGSDARVEIVPGADHGSLLTAELRARIRREMAEQYLRGVEPR